MVGNWDPKISAKGLVRSGMISSDWVATCS